MADSPHNPERIHPAMRVVMRLPGGNEKLDPWTGTQRSRGPNFDESDPAFDENVGLTPPLGKTAAQVEAELRPPPNLDNPLADQQDNGPWAQFSLKELIFLTTVVAVGAGGARLLPPAPLACLIGVLTFALMWFTTAVRVRHRWVHVASWGLLVMYIIATITALIQVR